MNIKELNVLAPWEWPEEAGDIVLEVLCDKKAPEADRIMAAEMAGNGMVMDDNMADHLLTIIRDDKEPEELRAKAASSFGPALEWADATEFDNPEEELLSEARFDEFREHLRKTFHDTAIPKNVRRRILEAAVHSPMEWHDKAIKEAESSGDPEWCITAVFAMGYVQGFQERLLEILEKENPETDIFYEAVRAIGEWGDTEAWPYLEKILTEHTGDKPLLLAAIEATGNLAIPEGSEILAEFIDSDDDDIAAAADDALEMAGMISEALKNEPADDDPSDDDQF